MTECERIEASLREVDFDLDVYPDEIGTEEVAERHEIAGWLDERNGVDLEAVRLWFADRGVEIGAEALRHNYEAWLGDLKSGYRDEAHGWFLFSPCGCNTLSFRAQEISSDPACDWQETYEC